MTASGNLITPEVAQLQHSKSLEHANTRLPILTGEESEDE
jgi:hypothetical protein